MLFLEGQESKTFFAIESGFVKVASLNAFGQEHILCIAGPGNFVPADHLFDATIIVSYFCTALSDCVVYKIDKAQFLAFAEKTPIVMTEIAKRMSRHYDNLITQLDSLEQSSVRVKLIATLIGLSRRFGLDDTVDLHKVGLRLTQGDLAEMIGSTRESASIELYKLMIEGAISYSRTRFRLYVSKLEELWAR
jgi:CRP-like cAMP-binding protein